jgi:uncharacterized membrane protein
MAYCVKCGNPVAENHGFCGVCGAPQPVSAVPPPAGPPPGPDPFAAISSRTASLLCYLPMVGWLAAIIALASNRFRHDAKVRFNAFQGLYLFVAWLIVDWVVSPIFNFPMGGIPIYKILPAVMKAVVFGSWIFMIIKAAHDEQFKLPIVGDLAEKSLIEQRQ